MTWATGAASAPTLRTYAEAVAHEAKVVPIRKRTPECKPLGRRDCTQLTIRKETKGRKTTIVVALYGEDRVVYHPGGKVDVILPYGSVGVTDSQLLWNLLRVRARHFDRRSWLRCSDGKTEGWFLMKKAVKEHRREYKGANGEPKVHVFKTSSYSASLVFSTNPYPTFTMLNVKHPTRTVINRQGAKQVRERYKEFGRLFRGVMKLETMAVADGSGIYAGHAHYSIQQAARHNHANATLIRLIRSKDTGDQMKAAQVLAQRYVFRESGYDWETKGYTYTAGLYKKKATDGYHTLLYWAHKKEAYTTETVTDGKLVKNRHHI